MLEVIDLTLTAGSRVLCDGLALNVQPGQLWCLLGRNGSGKTSLLRTLAGLRRADVGQVLLEGRPVQEWDLRQLARARAYLPQKFSDAFSASVLDTVLAGRFPHHGAGILERWLFANDGDTSIALGVLAELGIDALAQRDILTLSGGERQRVAVAAFLAQQARLLLLDEPVAHLDLGVERVVLGAVARRVHEQRCSAIIALHDLNLALRYATHALVLDDAQAFPCGPASAVLQAERLSRAFGHRVRELETEGQRWFAID